MQCLSHNAVSLSNPVTVFILKIALCACEYNHWQTTGRVCVCARLCLWMYTWLRAADQFTVPQQGPGGDEKKARERKTKKRLWASEGRNERRQSILRRWRFSKSLALSDSGFLEMKGAERTVRKEGMAAIATDPYREDCSLSLSIFLKSTMLSKIQSN